MKNIDLVFITDEGFALLTGVAIYSLKKNSNKNYNYNINIICSNVTEESLINFKKLSSNNFKINIVDVDGSKYEDLKKDNLHVSTTALFKFDLANIFSELNKILFEIFLIECVTLAIFFASQGIFLALIRFI